ncbi:hypothetical protein ABZP36_023709 [Zizania latifolia]
MGVQEIRGSRRHWRGVESVRIPGGLPIFDSVGIVEHHGELTIGDPTATVDDLLEGLESDSDATTTSKTGGSRWKGKSPVTTPCPGGTSTKRRRVILDLEDEDDDATMPLG